MIPKLNLSQRIAAGYVFIILITACFGIFTHVKVSENRKDYKELTEVLIPASDQIKTLQSLVKESQHLTTQIYLYPEENRLSELQKIHSETYPVLKTRLKFLFAQFGNTVCIKNLNASLTSCDKLFYEQNQQLQASKQGTTNLFANKINLHPAEQKSVPAASLLENQLAGDLAFLLEYEDALVKEKELFIQNRIDFLSGFILLILILVLVAGTVSALVTTRLIKQPIVYLKKTILAMSKGEIPEIRHSERKDEVGLINNAFSELTGSLKNKAVFASEIGKGNYASRFTLLSENDALGNALIEMNKNLRINAEAVQKENWVKGGIAQMSDILRNEHSNTGVLYTNIISFLSKYLVMNQGTLYLLKEDREKNKYFEMVAGFACDKNKALNKRVSFSDGYVGQSATEKNILLLRDIPPDYLKINSGLGEASPNNIIVVPLLFENELQGMVELASFSEINDLHVELLEKLSSIIAATFDLINRKLHTELLLFESQDLNDMLIERENALKKSNEELTEKGNQLKVSEEELREQQEELMQTNTQLEEKAQLLAEQNEEIRLKNEELEVAKEAIRIKAEELENTSRYKSEFLANMSHELRTPLNSILILSNLLSENKEQNMNEKQVEYARVVKRSGSDLLSLINDILDLSKIESRKIELDITAIKLKELGGDIESLFRELANDKKVNFAVNYGNELPEIIQSDKMRIEQVIKNLLSNAFKFTDKTGTVELNINLVAPGHTFNSSSIDNTKPMISLAVKDSGIGIPKDKQALIFEAFKQADGSTSRKYGGTGLGLSISKELSIILGGEIQIESIPGTGSTFTLFLPLYNDVFIAPDSNGQEVQQSNPVSHSTPVSTPIKNETVTPKIDVSRADRLVLIIEDDEDFAKILLSHAAKKGFTGMIATRGDTGLINAKRFKPDAIILDLNLPGMDGWSVMRRIKEDPELQHIPVHIMSGHDETQKQFPTGALEILRKPVSNDQLNSVFETLNNSLARQVKKVLIIEDNSAQNDSIKALLENPDLDCHSALTGKEAIEKLEAGHYDLITLDLSLPDTTGFELIKQIKGIDRYQQIPVIIYTGKTLTAEENRELKKYSDSIILKTEKSFERLVDETNLFLNKLDEGVKEIPCLVTKKVENPMLQSTKVVSGGEPSDMKGKKVLLVDDDIRNIFAMTSILEQQNCIIVVANDGKEALSMLAGNPDTDIVLMDIMMPEMDGYEAMKHIRAQEQFSKLPILALTAKAMKGDKEMCINAGASDYLSKPVDPTKLMSMMKILLFQ